MRKPFSYYSTARRASLAAFAGILAINLLSDMEWNSIWNCLCYSELCAISLLLMHPLSYEAPQISLYFETGTMLLEFCCFALLPHLGIDPSLSLLALPLLLMVYTTLRNRKKLAHIRLLFRRDSVWCSLEDQAQAFYGKLFLCFDMLVICSSLLGFGPMPFLAMSIVLGMLFCIMYRRAYTGRTMLISSRDEELIHSIIRNNLRSDLRPEENDEFMKNLYEKAVDYMESHLPYLDPDFTQEGMSRILYSNKLYLSKAINAFSGFNFRQFVNYYRINYSLALKKENPDMSVSQLAVRSGFHSVVTYNIAFKMHKRTTPGEYFRESFGL